MRAFRCDRILIGDHNDHISFMGLIYCYNTHMQIQRFFIQIMQI